MALNLVDLDELTRKLMLEEIDLDIMNNKLYMSNRLNGRGKSQYVELLKKSVMSGNSETLAQDLMDKFNPTETKNIRGKLTVAKLPLNANILLADGEFNRYYIRAMCRISIQNVCPLMYYRAKEANNPRSKTELRIGKDVDAKLLLDELRNNGIDTILEIPLPNSGLSVKKK